MPLRRLHIRFWHASTAQLTKLLRAAGAPEEALKLIKSVVDTCRVCRCWARPTPKAVAPTRLATDMNQTLQWDILFYKDKMISHVIDEATRLLRLHTAGPIGNVDNPRDRPILDSVLVTAQPHRR